MFPDVKLCETICTKIVSIGSKCQCSNMSSVTRKHDFGVPDKLNFKFSVIPSAKQSLGNEIQFSIALQGCNSLLGCHLLAENI